MKGLIQIDKYKWFPIEKAWQDISFVNFLQQKSIYIWYHVRQGINHWWYMHIWQLWGTPCLCIHNLTQVMRQMPKTCWGKAKPPSNALHALHIVQKKEYAFCNASKSKQVDGRTFKAVVALIGYQLILNGVRYFIQ